MPYCVSAEIIENQPLAAGYHHLILRAPEIAQGVHPGQFLQIRCTTEHDPFLRRPMAVHKLAYEAPFKQHKTPVGVSILYKVVGKGTRLLSEMQSGGTVEVIGPLGNWFSIDPARPVIIVAGGIGVSPFPLLVETIMKESKGEAKITVLYGASDADGLVCIEEFEDLGAEVRLATDDGSLGYKGLVTDLLPKSHDPGLMVYGCGPRAMLRALGSWAAQRDVECQVSLEARMGCGMGLCMSCACAGYIDNSPYRENRAQGLTYFLVCQDGPIFRTRDLKWEEA